MQDTDVSVAKLVTEHDQRLDEHELQLRVQAEQIKQLQDNAIKLENVIMTENRETRLTITETNKQLHELIKGLMGYKSGQSQMLNTLRMSRWESVAKIVGILAGSGGILYYIIETLSKQ
jgi:nicotinamide mononucleotide adenylyltransferase